MADRGTVGRRSLPPGEHKVPLDSYVGKDGYWFSISCDGWPNGRVGRLQIWGTFSGERRLMREAVVSGGGTDKNGDPATSCQIGGMWGYAAGKDGAPVPVVPEAIEAVFVTERTVTSALDFSVVTAPEFGARAQAISRG